MKKLIMFVMVIAIAAPALAEDLRVPAWAGGENTGYVLWEFKENTALEGGDQPTGSYYNPEPTTMTFGFRYNGEDGMEFTWVPGGGYSQNGSVSLIGVDEESVVMPLPEGTGATLTIQIQMTHKGNADEYLPELWADYSGDHLGDNWTSTTETDVALGDGWNQYTFTGTWSGIIPATATHFHMLNVIEGGSMEIDEIVVDMVRFDGASPPAGPGRVDVLVPNPILIDANDVTIYEPPVLLPQDDAGNFTVRLRNGPETGATVTAMIDPNDGNGGGNPDFTLLGSTIGPGDDPCDNRVYLTFTDATAADANDYELLIGSCPDWDPENRTSCWNCPQVVRFVATDDPCAEGPTLDELHTVLVSTLYPAHPTDANYVGEKDVKVTVMDNDQANMLLTITPKEKNNPKYPITGPVQIWEQRRLNFYNQWRRIDVKLQVEPVNDKNPGSPGWVRILVTNEDLISGNPPIMDPPLLPEAAVEPNAIVFTSDGNAVTGVIGVVRQWDVSYPIKIWGNEDDKLQADDAFADGGQNYPAEIVFALDDKGSSDERYGKFVTVKDDYGDPVEPTEWEWESNSNLAKTVAIDIEDNECGAYGILPMDISNPNYVTDPNWKSYDPDCQVDIYDLIEVARQWFDCSDPLDPACTSYIGVYGYGE